VRDTRSAFVKGQYGRYYDSLIPAQQKLVSYADYFRCITTSAITAKAFGVDLSTVRIDKAVTQPGVSTVSVPGTDEDVSAVTVTIYPSVVEGGKRAEQKPQDEYVVRVNGRWRMIDSNDLSKFASKDCGLGPSGPSPFSQNPEPSSTVSVDSYQGIPESLAVTRITEAGLKPEVDREYNGKVPIGIVYDQTPQAGDHVNKGDSVLIVVSKGKSKVEVPDVRGDTAEDAIRKLVQAGLDAKTYEVTSSMATGTVTGQSPAPGAIVPQGTTIRINVSKGCCSIAIPSDLIGKSQADSAAELQQLGFSVGSTRLQSSDKPSGEVIDTSPRPGTSVRSGSLVTLIVSKGPQAAPVPDLRGFDTQTAVATLRSAGFKPVVLTEDTNNRANDGIVLSESPEQNTQAPLGSPVTLAVGHYVPLSATGPTGP
jgi:beta-lactam-binding protein with PASTA domain